MADVSSVMEVCICVCLQYLYSYYTAVYAHIRTRTRGILKFSSLHHAFPKYHIQMILFISVYCIY